MSRICLLIVLTALAWSPAHAKLRTLTFRSALLTPAQGFPGVPGVSHFSFTFTATTLPAKGGCTSAGTAMVSFSDGVNSPTSLAAAGFTRVAAESLETICRTSTGKLDKAKTSIFEVWVRPDGAAYIASISLLQTQVGLQLPPSTDDLSGASTGRWKVVVG